ncbi:MAG: hypothetical protein IPG99_14585 [Ignavibacteria bacterium]|nr:hypothetical protein [Ignavibacteria bacterium]
MKNYDKALEIISKSNPTSCDEKLKIRGIELIVNFNMKNYETVYNLIRNFSSFIKYEKTLNTMLRDVFANFLNYLKKLTDMNTNHYDSFKKEKELSLMLSKLSTEKTANRKWLMSVMNGMYEKSAFPPKGKGHDSIKSLSGNNYSQIVINPDSDKRKWNINCLLQKVSE